VADNTGVFDTKRTGHEPSTDNGGHFYGHWGHFFDLDNDDKDKEVTPYGLGYWLLMS
jgi:hypothetical protein